MTKEDRRAFLRRLAKGAVYAAPVIHSMAAPLEAVGQGKSTSHKHAGKEGHGPWTGSAIGGPGLGGSAPGSQAPPGSEPPGTLPGSPGSRR